MVLPNSVRRFLVPGSVDLQYCYYLCYDYLVRSYLVPGRLVRHDFWCCAIILLYTQDYLVLYQVLLISKCRSYVPGTKYQGVQEV